MLERDILIEENYHGYKIIRHLKEDSDTMKAYKNKNVMYKVEVLNGNSNEAEDKIKSIINEN